jgi:protein phosphatase
VQIDVDALTHRGHKRSRNEDQFHVTKVTRSLETVLSSLPPGDVPQRAVDTDYVMMVADGMGGHAAGDIASRMAISALVDIALDIPDWIFRASDTHASEMERRWREGLEQVGNMMIEHGRQDPALCGMGSTLTMARVCGRDLVIIHIGDTRAYLFRRGHLERLTKDDTLAQMLIDTGRLSPNDAATSGVRHILTNALGGTHAGVEVAIRLVHLEAGDRLLLCSDGLSDCVDDDTIAKTLAEGTPSHETCEKLVRLALDRGGRDNVTVVVATFGTTASAMTSRHPLRNLKSKAAKWRDTYLSRG